MSNLVVVSGCGRKTAQEIKEFLEANLHSPFVVQMVMANNLLGVAQSHQHDPQHFRGIVISQEIADDHPELKKQCELFHVLCQVNEHNDPTHWKNSTYLMVARRLQGYPLEPFVRKPQLELVA